MNRRTIGYGWLTGGLIACLAASGCGKPAAPLSSTPAPELAKGDAAPLPVAPAADQPRTPDDVAADAQAYVERVERALGHAAASPPPADRPGEVQWVSPGDSAASPRASSPAPGLRPVADTPPVAVVVPPSPLSPAAAPSPAVEAPAPAPEPLTTADQARRLAQQLRAAAADAPPNLQSIIRRAALSVIDPTIQVTNEELASLDAEQRRAVTAWQRAFLQLGQMLGADASSDADQLLIAAAELQEQVAGEKRLKIRSAKLCTRVNGYGVYEELPTRELRVGREHAMIVYLELDHFTPQVAANGKYMVKLSQEVVLYNDADRQPVWREQPVSITDESHNRRRDFFTVQIIRLSPHLTIGNYHLKVTVTDEVGQSIDEATIPLRITADGKLAER